MIKSHEYSLLLDKLFNPDDQSLRIDLNILKQICASDDYHKIIDLTSILTRLFLAGKQKLSIRELIGKKVNSEQPQKQQKVEFFIDGLTSIELSQLVQELFVVQKKLKFTVYSARLGSVLCLLKKVLDEHKGSNDRKYENVGSLWIGDFEIIEEQYKKAVATSPLQLGASQLNTKIAEILKNPRHHLDGRFSNFTTLQKYISKEIFPFLQRNVLTIPLNNHTERQHEISRILKFINSYYMPQYKLEVQISKNTLVQNRVYTNKLYKQYLFRHYSEMLKTIAMIINQAILCPSSIHIQLMLLRMLRRVYLLGEQSQTHSSETLQNIRTNPSYVASSPANYVRNPLFLVLRNISLFSEGHDDQIKEAAMLCYKIVNQKSDLQLSSMIENAQDLRFLRNSKFFTSKAYIYSEQIQRTYEPSELASLPFKQHQNIAARELWTYTILVEKPSSLLCWQFYIGGFDIKFGIYKLQQLRDLTPEQYEKGVGCRQVHKMQKIQNTTNSPRKGHVFLKNGLYMLVFDNSFSMMRSKELYYSLLHLESSA